MLFLVFLINTAKLSFKKITKKTIRKATKNCYEVQTAKIGKNKTTHKERYM